MLFRCISVVVGCLPLVFVFALIPTLIFSKRSRSCWLLRPMCPSQQTGNQFHASSNPPALAQLHLIFSDGLIQQGAVIATAAALLLFFDFGDLRSVTERSASSTMCFLKNGWQLACCLRSIGTPAPEHLTQPAAWACPQASALCTPHVLSRLTSQQLAVPCHCSNYQQTGKINSTCAVYTRWRRRKPHKPHCLKNTLPQDNVCPVSGIEAPDSTTQRTFQRLSKNTNPAHASRTITRASVRSTWEHQSSQPSTEISRPCRFQRQGLLGVRRYFNVTLDLSKAS